MKRGGVKPGLAGAKEEGVSLIIGNITARASDAKRETHLFNLKITGPSFVSSAQRQSIDLLQVGESGKRME